MAETAEKNPVRKGSVSLTEDTWGKLAAIARARFGTAERRLSPTAEAVIIEAYEVLFGTPVDRERTTP